MQNRPIIPKGSHPVEKGTYSLATNEIYRLYKNLKKWLRNNAPGCIIYGRPRLGKTKAIRYLEYYLKQDFGEQLPIFKIACRKHLRANPGVFFSDILKDIGHSLYDKGKPEMKRDRIINYFIERAQVSNQYRIVVFIDEAQHLLNEDYDWLMDIHNELDSNSIKMTVILVGQIELLARKGAFNLAGKSQIIGRFMIHEYPFSGIKNVQDVRTCLEGYDIQSEYPKGSGCSYTRFYFPEAFEEGRRLSDDAEIIFNKFVELRTQLGNISPIEIPMQYLTLTIDNCLRNFGADGDSLEWPCEAQWEEAIIDSGYLEADAHYSMFKDLQK